MVKKSKNVYSVSYHRDVDIDIDLNEAFDNLSEYDQLDFLYDTIRNLPGGKKQELAIDIFDYIATCDMLDVIKECIQALTPYDIDLLKDYVKNL